MDFYDVLDKIKGFFVIAFKWLRKMFRKLKKLLKRYIRLLVKHTKAKDYSILIYSVVILMAVVLLFSLLFGSSGDKKKKKKEKQNPTTTEATTEITTEDPMAILAEQCRAIYNSNQSLLAMINDQNPVADDYTFEHYTLKCGQDIDNQAIDALKSMLEACNNAGNEYSIIRGYQGGDNTDEHITGLAIDLSSLEGTTLDTYNENDGTNKWLRENSYKYGFIHRYPSDKVTITGVDNEPWHYRYVGVEAAGFLYSNQLTLEEFYSMINYQ